MKKDKIIPIFFFSLTLFLISFIFGYQLMSKRINPNNSISQINQDEIDIHHNSDLEILKEEAIITPGTFIEERIHYTACDHIITKVTLVKDEFVNMSKKEYSSYLENNYPSYKLVAFSSSKVTIGITKNHLCENHYVVGEEDGIIAIFRIGENGEKILEKIFTDYPISLLMEIDQQKIIEGIIVDSEDELSEILENFIS